MYLLRSAANLQNRLGKNRDASEHILNTDELLSTVHPGVYTVGFTAEGHTAGKIAGVASTTSYDTIGLLTGVACIAGQELL